MNEADITFWLVAGLLTLAALSFILPSLLRSKTVTATGSNEQNILIAKEQLKELKADHAAGKISEEVYQQSHAELERALLNDVSDETISLSSGRSNLLVAVVAIVVPTLAVTIYLLLGTPVNQVLSARKAHSTNQMDINNMAALTEKLALRLEQQPNDLKGWLMLGRSYQVLEQYTKAANAYARAATIEPQNPNIMLYQADSLVMASNGSFAGKASELINQALVLQPNNITALWLAGMAADQRGEVQVALDHWNKIVPQVQSDAKSLAQIQQMIQEARAKLGQADNAGAPAVTEPQVVTQPQPVTAPAGISVKVSLSESLNSKVAPTDTVFIYAKASHGPPMPLAVSRHQVKDLPITVVLDDSMAMMPAMKISNFQRVNIGARVSKSGNAIAQAGDYYNEAADIEITTTIPVSITIDKQK